MIPKRWSTELSEFCFVFIDRNRLGTRCLRRCEAPSATSPGFISRQPRKRGAMQGYGRALSLNQLFSEEKKNGSELPVLVLELGRDPRVSSRPDNWLEHTPLSNHNLIGAAPYLSLIHI